MTYLSAADKADDAARAASVAVATACRDDDFHRMQLAQSVKDLAEAVAELARSMHRASD